MYKALSSTVQGFFKKSLPSAVQKNYSSQSVQNYSDRPDLSQTYRLKSNRIGTHSELENVYGKAELITRKILDNLHKIRKLTSQSGKIAINPEDMTKIWEICKKLGIKVSAEIFTHFCTDGSGQTKRSNVAKF
jgi:hypothetical protein